MMKIASFVNCTCCKQIALVANCTCCKVYMLPIQHVANCMYWKLQVEHIAGFANCTCCKLHMLQIEHIANCKCCKLHLLQANCTCCKLHMLQSVHAANLTSLGEKFERKKVWIAEKVELFSSKIFFPNVNAHFKYFSWRKN